MTLKIEYMDRENGENGEYLVTILPGGTYEIPMGWIVTRIGVPK